VLLPFVTANGSVSFDMPALITTASKERVPWHRHRHNSRPSAGL